MTFQVSTKSSYKAKQRVFYRRRLGASIYPHLHIFIWHWFSPDQVRTRLSCDTMPSLSNLSWTLPAQSTCKSYMLWINYLGEEQKESMRNEIVELRRAINQETYEKEVIQKTSNDMRNFAKKAEAEKVELSRIIHECQQKINCNLSSICFRICFVFCSAVTRCLRERIVFIFRRRSFLPLEACF